MAKFLTTTKTTLYLEDLIKDAQQRLILISPYLRFNDRIKELLKDKDRLDMTVRIVYGKTELSPVEINWLKSLDFVQTRFCQNLHAKCYLNENGAIITSMNLYEYSQVNNNEMGVYIDKEKDAEVYKDTCDEVERLIRISEPLRLSADKVEEPAEKFEEPTKKVEAPAKKAVEPARKPEADSSGGYAKLTTSKLAKQLGIKTAELNERLLTKSLIRREGDEFKITDAGEKAGGETRYSKKYGAYLLWPKDLSI